MAEAHENVRKPSYKSSSLLNPWNVKPEDLSAFKEFREELEPYRAKVLPFPRVKPATVGVVFCKASEIQKDHLPRITPPHKVAVWVNPRDTIMPTWYTAVLHALYPVRVVMSEDLAEEVGGTLKALVFPDASCAESAVVAAARAFAARGGLVLAPDDAFRYDEFLKKRTEDLSFVTRVADVETALAVLAKAEVPRYAALEPLDDTEVPIRRADVQVCDRGDFKLICLAAMGESTTRRVRLSLRGLSNGGPWRLKNGVTNKVLPAPKGAGWTLGDVANGIALTLAPQERVILVMEKVK